MVLGRTTQTLDHVVVVHITIRDKRKSQINEYSDFCKRQLYLRLEIKWKYAILQIELQVKWF